MKHLDDPGRKGGEGMTAALLNRPMLSEDLAGLCTVPAAVRISDLVHRYGQAQLPVLNGGFAFSNLVEGPAQALTCPPYRLWEYASLFLVREGWGGGGRFLDVGGAGAPLAYDLAEAGHEGLAVDLQPLLVDLCNHVARVRGLPLQARVGHIEGDFDDLEESFDLITFVSVLEHIPVSRRSTALERMRRLLKPEGLLYMTFDYGPFRDAMTYDRDSRSGSTSIEAVEPVAAMLEAAGFRFEGNDPRSLPSEVLALQAAPAHRQVMRQRALTIGPVDGHTPWRILLVYAARRLLRIRPGGATRFARHSFFRLFLRRA